MILGFDFDRLHFCSTDAVCFVRGLNDTPKITALLLAPGVTAQGIITVALAMLPGGLFSARRVAETISHKITPITHGQGLLANLVTALPVIFASKLGMPVSVSYVSVGSLSGIGLVSGKADTGVIGSIVLTLSYAAICAAALYYVAIGASLQ
ncbi:MAG: inorganic phosphate transporter [Methylovulum sp.]|nr:inorganic phosphate transporter [Methylovulum sp.]